VKRPPVEIERLYTPKETAAKFGIVTGTLDRWARTGRIPASQVVRTLGGQRRYRAAYIDALTNGSTTP
jgi:predicted site-specific integrase-resolvase